MDGWTGAVVELCWDHARAAPSCPGAARTVLGWKEKGGARAAGRREACDMPVMGNNYTFTRI